MDFDKNNPYSDDYDLYSDDYDLYSDDDDLFSEVEGHSWIQRLGLREVKEDLIFT